MKLPIKFGKRSSRWFGNRGGSAMIELALGSIVIVPLFTAAFQYGYIFYQYNLLYSVIDNAAKFASTYPYTTQCNTPIDSTFATAVKRMAVYGNPSTSYGTELVNGLTTRNINVRVTGIGTCNDDWAPATVTVGVGGTDGSGNTVSSYTISAVFGTFNANDKPKVAYPYSGQYQP